MPTGWSCNSSATAGLPQEWIPFYFILWLVENSTAACSWLLAHRLPSILLAVELDAFAKAKEDYSCDTEVPVADWINACAEQRAATRIAVWVLHFLIFWVIFMSTCTKSHLLRISSCGWSWWSHALTFTTGNFYNVLVWIRAQIIKKKKKIQKSWEQKWILLVLLFYNLELLQWVTPFRTSLQCRRSARTCSAVRWKSSCQYLCLSHPSPCHEAKPCCAVGWASALVVQWPCSTLCSMVTLKLWIVECRYRMSVSLFFSLGHSLCRCSERTWSLPWSYMTPSSWTLMNTMCWQIPGGRSGKREFRCQLAQGPSQNQ